VNGSAERAKADKALADALTAYGVADNAFNAARKAKLKKRLPAPAPTPAPTPAPPSSPSSLSPGKTGKSLGAPGTPSRPVTMTDLVETIKKQYKGEPNKEFWNKVAYALDENEPFYNRNKDGSLAGKQPNAGKLIEPFLKDKNPKAQALVAYLTTTDKKAWDNDDIYKIAKGAATIHTGSGQSGTGQKGSGQKGGFFLSALAGVAIPAIISAIAGSGKSGSGYTHYKPKQKKNKYDYLK